MNIRVHIERLILEGLPVGAHDGPRVQAAVAAELERLIGRQGIADSLRSGGAAASVIAKPMAVARDASPRRVGTDIARAVYGGIGRPE